MSMMGDLNYFLGFQVKQLKKGTFISPKKVHSILAKKVWDEGRKARQDANENKQALGPRQGR
jgi:hypothetical protein